MLPKVAIPSIKPLELAHATKLIQLSVIMFYFTTGETTQKHLGDASLELFQKSEAERNYGGPRNL